MDQLATLFSPGDLAFRADDILVEDGWTTLLRDEMDISGSILDVSLECSPSRQVENIVIASLNLTVTSENPDQPVQFPLLAHLDWGTYQESIALSREGRTDFPEIPLTAVYDLTQRKIHSGFRLTLETVC